MRLIIPLLLVLTLFTGCTARPTTPPPQRFGWVIMLKPDQVERYKTLHAQVWPGVQRMITACNIHNYTIYLRETEPGSGTCSATSNTPELISPRHEAHGRRTRNPALVGGDRSLPTADPLGQTRGDVGDDGGGVSAGVRGGYVLLLSEGTVTGYTRRMICLI